MSGFCYADDGEGSFGNGPGGRNLRDFHMVCIGCGLTFEKNKEIRYNKSVVSGKILRQIKKEG